MTGTTTLRCIACYIHKFALASAFRTDSGWNSCRDSETTLTAFPVGQTTLWTYVSFKLARGRVTATRTHILFLFIGHIQCPPFSIDHSESSSWMTFGIAIVLFSTACPGPRDQKICLLKLGNSVFQKESTNRYIS